MRKVGYVAFDHGPKETLQALACRLPGTWLAPRAINREEIDLVICGTSDTSDGRSAEAAARKAARRLGIPLVVIEDFAGNYSEVPEGQPELLFVDSDFAATLAHAKEPPLRVEICPSVRYDPLRRRLRELRRQADQSDKHAVLWVGQPETPDSLETLKRLLPALAAREITLWFRAHPRDAGYARGAYRSLFESADLKVEDVTASPLDDCLKRRPILLVTQFSSVAIEAGFWGICSLNVLFPDLGGRALAAKKGYPVPRWCEEGAAFLILHPDDAEKVLDRALGPGDARKQVIQSFDRYFRVQEEGSQRLINVLYNQRLL